MLHAAGLSMHILQLTCVIAFRRKLLALLNVRQCSVTRSSFSSLCFTDEYISLCSVLHFLVAGTHTIAIIIINVMIMMSSYVLLFPESQGHSKAK